eukprot:4928072-Amphidinium_carterae.2
MGSQDPQRVDRVAKYSSVLPFDCAWGCFSSACQAMQNEVMFKQLEIWEYARQLSSALDHMHKKRIMHRDLKPANIFVAQDAGDQCSSHSF